MIEMPNPEALMQIYALNESSKNKIAELIKERVTPDTTPIGKSYYFDSY